MSLPDPTTPAALESALLNAIAWLPPPPPTAAAVDEAPAVRLGDMRLGDMRLAESRLGESRLWELFDAQVTSRHLDMVARWLRAEHGRGYYTIGSAGHEANAAVAMALRPTDPALLHYRSGGFYIARAHQVPGHRPVDDVILGMLAAADEPIAGGRHKVFGHHALAVIPQTSTIASHLPRALGVAAAIARGRNLGLTLEWPADAVTVCSFGDASTNHSTATGAINAAAHTTYSGRDLPLLFVCEDNGMGISVRTPAGWIAAAYGSRAGLRYVGVDGHDVPAVLEQSAAIADWVRTHRQPAFLHLRTVRYLGHAGSDAELGYRSAEEIRASFAVDPILGTARALAAAGVVPTTIVDRYRRIGESVRTRAVELLDRPELTTADQVMAPLAPRQPDMVALAVARSQVGVPPTVPISARAGSPAPSRALNARTMAQAINATLAEALTANPGVVVFGEDVANKGGVYGVTKGLAAKFGAERVFDTILDETSILGLALGAAVSGLTPIPEIQYLAYLHNAEDQLRGEAATLSYFSQGAYRNGMVIRIASYAYQKGFGGHFHNDNAVGVLRDLPGIVVASPARAADAAGMLRTLVAAAQVDGTVGVFLEPIARYHTTELHEPGDGLWSEADDKSHIPIGSPRIYGTGRDLTIVSWANGLYMSRRVARQLEETHGIDSRVVDVRWLSPLPLDEVFEHASATGRVLIAEETRHSGGVGEGIVAGLVERGFDGVISRVASKDSFIPLGEAANLVLLSEDDIEAAALAMMRGHRVSRPRVRLAPDSVWARGLARQRPIRRT